MSYWSVRDGAITGQSTADHPCHSNQFIVWQGGDVADFELKLKFRLRINGVQCSELIDQEEGHFDLKGILGLQLRSGEPMTVQFKDIFLKPL